MSKTLDLICYSGVGQVTGANFMLSGEPGKMLIDCGLVQGSKFAPEENQKAFGYDPASVGVRSLPTHTWTTSGVFQNWCTMVSEELFTHLLRRGSWRHLCLTMRLVSLLKKKKIRSKATLYAC